MLKYSDGSVLLHLVIFLRSPNGPISLTNIVQFSTETQAQIVSFLVMIRNKIRTRPAVRQEVPQNKIQNRRKIPRLILSQIRQQLPAHQARFVLLQPGNHSRIKGFDPVHATIGPKHTTYRSTQFFMISLLRLDFNEQRHPAPY